MGEYVVRLKGFQPDIKSDDEGVLMFGSSILPTRNGYSIIPNYPVSGSTFTGGTAISMASVQFLDETSRIFLSTNSQIYMSSAFVSWTNVGRSTAYATATASLPWAFAQFEDATLAAQKSNVLQRRTATGNFADVSGAPSAAYLEIVNQFAFVANTATSSSQWICSALGNPTDWAPSVTTQCATGQLTSAPGPITGMKRLGDNIVIYKEHAIFLGRYVGPQSNTWAFEKIPGSIGCIANGSIIDIGYAHLFIGRNDFYIFDGTRPIALNAPCREHIMQIGSLSLNWARRKLIQSAVDEGKKIAYWFYPIGFTTEERSYTVCLNYERTNNREAWGFVAGQWSCYVANNIHTTFGMEPAIIGSSNNAPRYVGGQQSTITETSSGSFVISPIGRWGSFRTLKQVRPRWIFPRSTNTQIAATGNLSTFNDPGTAVGSLVFNGRTLIGESWSPNSPVKLEVMESAQKFNVTIIPYTPSIPITSGQIPELSELAFDFEEDGEA